MFIRPNFNSSGGARSAGLFGYVQSTSILNVRLDNIIIQSHESNTGALVGHARNTIIKNSSSSGFINVINSGNSSSVGGLVGQLLTGLISLCYSYVNINATTNIGNLIVGGIVGHTNFVVLSNSFSRISTNNGAGLVGGGIVTIKNCYVATTLPINSGIALVSTPIIGTALINNFWDIDVTMAHEALILDRVILPQEAHGLSSSQMKLASSFRDWDFHTIWDIDTEINDGYPHLRNKLIPSAQLALPVLPMGAGTVNNPYQIANLSNLRWLSDNTNTMAWGSSETNRRFYIQTADIDAFETVLWNNGQGFRPIGDTYERRFFGVYNGNNFSIYNLVSRFNGGTNGMFGYIDSSSIVNLNLSDIILISSRGSIGGLVGYARSSSIKNSSTSGLINVSQSNFDVNVGGILGRGSNGNNFILYCSSDVNIVNISNSPSNTGGLIGSLLSGSLKNSFFNGGLNRGSGLIGNAGSTLMIMSNNYVSTKYPILNGSGLIQNYTSVPFLSSNYWNIDTTGVSLAFGTGTPHTLVQARGLTTEEMMDQTSFNNWDFDKIWNMDPTVQNGFPFLRDMSISTIQVVATRPMGSGTESNPFQIANLSHLRWFSENTNVAAWGSSANDRRFYIQIADIDASETITWNNNEGFSPIGSNSLPFHGFYNGNHFSINNLFSSSCTTGSFAGLFGHINNTQLIDLNIVNVELITFAPYVSAIAGRASNSEIINCSSSGVIISSSGNPIGVGGIAGEAWNTRIIYCHSDINISNSSNLGNLGGLIGNLSSNSHSVLTNSYFRGFINRGGGLVGRINSNTSMVSFNYVATLTPIDNGSAIAYLVDNSPIFYNNLWDIETTGTTQAFGNKQENPNYALGLSSHQMKLHESYNEWDFDHIWAISYDVNNGYPFLNLKYPSPLNVIATPGNQHAVLGWEAPEFDSYFGNITGYNVYRNGLYILTTPSTMFSYTDYGLSNGTMYTYNITALYVLNESPMINPVTVTPYLSVPNKVMLIYPENNSINISVNLTFEWESDTLQINNELQETNGFQIGREIQQTPTLNSPLGRGLMVLDVANNSTNTSSAPTHYRLEVSKNASFIPFVVNQNIIHPTTVFTLTNPSLLHNTQYYWRVIAINSTGESMNNKVWSFITQETPTINVLASGLSTLKVNQAISDASVIFALSNGIYATTITPDNFTVAGLPAGMTAGTATRTSDTVVTIPIIGTPTTYTTASTNLTIPTSIPASNIVSATSAITPTGTPTAGPIVKGDGMAVGGAPTVNTVTYNSISVNLVTIPINPGGQTVEYSISTSQTTPTTGWQSDTTFTGLNANTTYYIFARSAENENYLSGIEQMSAGILTSNLPQITVTTSGLSTLKVNQAISDASVLFTLSNGIYASTITPDNFTVTGFPAGMTAVTATRTSDTVVTVAIIGTPTTHTTASTNLTIPTSIPAPNIVDATASITPTGTPTAYPIAKGDGMAVSGPPTVNIVTFNSISVNPVTIPTNPGYQTVEYAINTSQTTPSTGWQSDTSFTGLNTSTTYYVFARSAENSNYLSGTTQTSAGIHTTNFPQITVTDSGLSTLKVNQSVSDASILFTISNGIYATTITPEHFTITGLPSGLTAGKATRTSDTLVTVAITGTPTTHTTTSTNLTIPTNIPASNVVGATSAITPTGTPTAAPIAKGDGMAVSGAPTVNTVTFYSITVNHVTIPTNPGGQTVEYAIRTATTTPTSGWQNSTSFADLNANMTYYVFARSAENTNYLSGTAQISAGILTTNLPQITVTASGLSTLKVNQSVKNRLIK